MDSREQICQEKQGSYWDSLAGEYAAITRIRTDDFHYGPQIPGEKTLRLLPAFPAGATSLELGCGEGQNSIFLAKQGLRCTALDISEAQLAYARKFSAAEGVRVEWKCASIESFDSVLPSGENYDFIHSSHAMEFIQDPAAILRKISAVSHPGTILMVSTVHPLFNGQWTEGEFELGAEAEETFADAGDGLFLSSYFQPPDDIREDANGFVISRAWPVSSWFRWFRQAGFEVLALEEPAAVADAPYTSDDWANHEGQLTKIPSTIILVGRKQ